MVAKARTKLAAICFVTETLLLWLIVVIDFPDRATTALGRVAWGSAMAALLTGFWVGIPIVLEAITFRLGLIKLGKSMVVMGVVMLVVTSYVALVVPTVWESTGECLPPGVAFDGRCELGPL